MTDLGRRRGTLRLRTGLGTGGGRSAGDPTDKRTDNRPVKTDDIIMHDRYRLIGQRSESITQRSMEERGDARGSTEAWRGAKEHVSMRCNIGSRWWSLGELILAR